MLTSDIFFPFHPDHSSSSGTLSFQPLRSQGSIPTAHVMPSPSSSKLSVTQSVPGSPWNSSQLSSPVCSPLDMKDPRPVRRWSSLTRLSGQEKSGRTSCNLDAHGSLDRSLLRADSSPLKPSTLDLSYSALPESRASLVTPRGHSLGHQAVGGSPIQPSVRTQMWLSEQMEFRPEGVNTWLSEQRMRQETELSQLWSHELDENEHEQQHDDNEHEVEQQVETSVVGEIHGADVRAGVSELGDLGVRARCEAPCGSGTDVRGVRCRVEGEVTPCWPSFTYGKS
ncbi:centrosomal protein of 85 kDa-like isoform X1 [Tachysurus ichikawai]